jgi:hypothetical protein
MYLSMRQQFKVLLIPADEKRNLLQNWCKWAGSKSTIAASLVEA